MGASRFMSLSNALFTKTVTIETILKQLLFLQKNITLKYSFSPITGDYKKYLYIFGQKTRFYSHFEDQIEGNTLLKSFSCS